MAAPIDIIGGFYTVGGRSWAAQDCVNYLPMAAEVSGTKTQTMLRTPPGLRPWVKIGEGPEFAIRGAHDVEGAFFVVAGSKLYQITNARVAIPLGTIPGVGRVSMAHNQIAGGNQLIVVNGSAGYVWNTVTQEFKRVTDEGYPGASVAQFVNSYIMQLEPFGRFLFFSDLADALDYNTLDRFEAEAQPDPVVSILTDQNEVLAFGTRTIQPFENTGAAQGTFQSKGIVIGRGCAGRFTPVKMDNSVFWLGDDGIFYRLEGYSPRRISTHAIEEAIAGLDWSQAFGMVWTDQGHTVAYWTFPDGQTWGFDVSSGLWHRRASYHPIFEVSRRWRISTLTRSNGKWIAGDLTSGRLYVLDWDYMLEDVAEPLVSERTTQIAYGNGARFSVDSVELLMRTGEMPTVGVEFPIQPAGPSISGEAPSGGIGFAYPGYAYTITPGDAPITRIQILEGALPGGLAFDTATGAILPGLPSSGGTFTVRIRVTDANGLWADLIDTLEISPVFFMLFGTGTEGVWISPDLDTWSPKFGFIPSLSNQVHNAEGSQGKLAIDVINDTGASRFEKYLQAPMPPWADGFVPVVETKAVQSGTSIIPSYMHDYGGVLVTWERNGNFPFYNVSTDGGATYTEVPTPNGWRPWGISRMNSGRWVAFFSLGPDRGLFYTDEEIPTSWTPASSVVGTLGFAPSYDAIVAGEYAYFIDDIRRVFRTPDGSAWSQVGSAAGLKPDSPVPFLTSNGTLIIHGANADGVVQRSTTLGVSFDEVRFAPSGDMIKMSEAGGYLIGSRNSTSFSVSQNDGASFVEKTPPFGGFGSQATVIGVESTVEP